MMKKRFICCLCLAIFTAVSLFGFTACGNGSSYDDSALVDRIEALEDQITQQGETIKDQQDTIDEQSQTIENQAAAITALQNSVTELQTAKTKLEEQIASLENDNTANKTDIQTLKTKVEALEAANENFQQQLAALDTSSATFTEDLAELTSNYNTLAASVQNATHIERVVVKEEDIGSEQLITSDPTIIVGTDNNYLVVGCVINFSSSLIPYQIVTCKVNIGYNNQNTEVNIYLTRADIGETSSSMNSSVVTNIQVQNAENITKEFSEVVLYRFY